MSQTEFRVVKDIIQPDNRGRISLGTQVSEKTYRMLTNELGEILLVPVVAIPERERWLFNNSEALNAVKQGLRESAENQNIETMSFAEYADLELEDE